MRKIIFIMLMAAGTMAFAQDFNKHIATAKSSYNNGKLEDARFAMQQMLNELDMAIGREILNLLPAKMDAHAANAANDNVTANTGLAGVVVHRDYGTGEQKPSIEIMSNSPLVASINAILSIPFMGNSGDGSQKIIKVDGYKGILQKTVDTETSKTDYSLQIPIGSTLLTFNAPHTAEADVLRMANTIPISQITKLAQ